MGYELFGKNNPESGINSMWLLTLNLLTSGAPTNTYHCYWKHLFTKRQQQCWILKFQRLAIKHPTGSKFSRRSRCKTKSVGLFRSFWSLSDKNVQVLPKNILLFLQYLCMHRFTWQLTLNKARWHTKTNSSKNTPYLSIN